MGDTEYADTYEVTFGPTGSVVVVDEGGDRQAFPEGLADGRVRFDGAIRPELTVRNAYSREKFDFQVDSGVRLVGTRSVRVNFRWVAMPATAVFKAPASQAGG